MQPEPNSPSRSRVIISLLLALIAGLALRQSAFNHTQNVRREFTQRNTFYWGDQIVLAAHPAPGPATWLSLWKSYVALYDAPPKPNAENFVLDYVPLRLFMAAVWVNYLNIHFGPVNQWRPEFARSFTVFSLATELLAAVAMFALVARWLKRAAVNDPSPSRWTRWDKAALAAIVLWLNPASILDSHVWPHGQTWVLPFYLFAILAMVEQKYLLAGTIFGLGSMFKGQMMIVAPALILWPVFDRRWLAAARFILGLAIGIAIVTWPWLIHGSFAWAHAGFAADATSNDVLRKGIALNLPSILAREFHMTLHQRLLHLLELKTALILIFAFLLAITAWGLSRLARTPNPRLLVALSAPWGLMFFILAQMDERYLTWAAAFSAAGIVVSRRAFAAHLMLTWSAAAGVCEELIFDKPLVHPHLTHLLERLNPVTLLLTAIGVAILFYESIPPRKKSTPMIKSPAA